MKKINFKFVNYCVNIDKKKYKIRLRNQISLSNFSGVSYDNSIIRQQAIK